MAVSLALLTSSARSGHARPSAATRAEAEIVPPAHLHPLIDGQPPCPLPVLSHVRDDLGAPSRLAESDADSLLASCARRLDQPRPFLWAQPIRQRQRVVPSAFAGERPFALDPFCAWRPVPVPPVVHVCLLSNAARPAATVPAGSAAGVSRHRAARRIARMLPRAALPAG